MEIGDVSKIGIWKKNEENGGSYRNMFCNICGIDPTIQRPSVILDTMENINKMVWSITTIVLEMVVVIMAKPKNVKKNKNNYATPGIKYSRALSDNNKEVHRYKKGY